ncbi:biotin--[acetyl-CoA-carboxylase] ligase [Aquifex pyrophilus]
MFERLLWLKETDSTQKRLKEWNLPYGTVIVADIQKEGRGRKGRKWVSQEGGLYFSFLLDPKRYRDLIQLPLILGYALSQAFEDLTGISFKIKWPNDVYYENKKVAGILCELYREKLIAGIGVNLNQKNVPEEIKERATTLYLITGRETERREALLKILGNISKNLREFEEKGFKAFKDRIEKRLLYVNEEVKLFDEERSFYGKFVGLSQRGGALIYTDEGIREFLSGDLSLRRCK